MFGRPSGAQVMAAIDRLLPPDGAVVEEAPTHRNDLWEHLRIRRPGSFFAGASGGLGWAVAAAPGVALARPGRPVACVVGDGSALFGIQAMWTAAQWHLPVTFIILNTGGYGALKSFGRMLGIPAAPGHDLDGLDFAALAAGFGCPARRVTDAAHLESTLEAAFASHSTSLIEVVMNDGGPELY